jgi:hypothetical protein
MDATIHKDGVEKARKAGPPDLSALENKKLTPTEVKQKTNTALSEWKAKQSEA